MGHPGCFCVLLSSAFLFSSESSFHCCSLLFIAQSSFWNVASQGNGDWDLKMRRRVTKITGLKVRLRLHNYKSILVPKKFLPLFFIKILSIASDALLLSSPNPHRWGWGQMEPSQDEAAMRCVRGEPRTWVNPAACLPGAQITPGFSLYHKPTPTTGAKMEDSRAYSL